MLYLEGGLVKSGFLHFLNNFHFVQFNKTFQASTLLHKRNHTQDIIMIMVKRNTYRNGAIN